MRETCNNKTLTRVVLEKGIWQSG